MHHLALAAVASILLVLASTPARAQDAGPARSSASPASSASTACRAHADAIARALTGATVSWVRQERVSVSDPRDELTVRFHCNDSEAGEQCEARARRSVDAGSPGWDVDAVEHDGTPSGRIATLDVDGSRRTVSGRTDEAIADQMHVLIAAGHHVLLIEVREDYLPGSQNLVLHLRPGPSRQRVVLQWQAELFWRGPIAAERIVLVQRAAESERVLVRELSAQQGGFVVRIGCP